MRISKITWTRRPYTREEAQQRADVLDELMASGASVRLTSDPVSCEATYAVEWGKVKSVRFQRDVLTKNVFYIGRRYA